MRSRGAARDPVARHAISLTLFGERNLSGSLSDLNASLLEARFRWHVPGPVNNTVLALTGAVQQQDENWISFSRSSVIPRGYHESDLDGRWIRDGRLAKLGVESHFPLLFPDWGWGLGAWYVERVTGLLFAEAAAAWGSTEPKTPIASVGGELVLRGYGLYEVQGSARMGVAYLQKDRKFSVYFSWSLPLSVLTGDGRPAFRNDDLREYRRR